MAYFDRFPTGQYDIAGDKNYKLVSDLFKRIKVRSKIQNVSPGYDYVTFDYSAYLKVAFVHK